MKLQSHEADGSEIVFRQADRLDQWAAEHQARAAQQTDAAEQHYWERAVREFRRQACRLRAHLEDGTPVEEIIAICIKFAGKCKAAQFAGDRELLFMDDSEIDFELG